MPQLSDPRGFNALDVLNISHENYYSKVFAWLLDPRASHGRRRFFLDWFLRRCGEGRGAKFESVRTEEALGGDERTAKNRTDISLRCKGLLVFVECKINRQAIRKGQLKAQIRAGQKKAEEEGRRFRQAFLVPDEESMRRTSQTEVSPLTWAETVGFLKKHLKRAKTPKATSAKEAESFMRQFVDHVERSILGEFRGLDPTVFKRKYLGLGAHVDEEAAKLGLRDLFIAVDKEVRRRLPARLTEQVENTIGHRWIGGCYLLYFTNGHKSQGIDLYYDVSYEGIYCSLRADKAVHRVELFDQLQKLGPKTVPLQMKWQKHGERTAISKNLMDVYDQTKMLNDCVDHLVKYIKVFAPEMRSFQREHGLIGKSVASEKSEQTSL